MNERNVQSKKRYLLAFIIGTAIFFFVFLISYGISSLEFQRVSNMQTSLAYNIFSHKLNYTLFANEICSSATYEQVTEDFNFQREIINELENKLGKNNKAVIERKKFYTLIELEHFEFLQRLNKECNQSVNLILFFYSNNYDDLKKSEDAGRILDAVYNNNQANLMVYSFDINLDSQLINSLKQKYSVGISPTIVVNDNIVIAPKNILEIEKYLV